MRHAIRTKPKDYLHNNTEAEAIAYAHGLEQQRGAYLDAVGLAHHMEDALRAWAPEQLADLPRRLAGAPAWHCHATTYDDETIRVYVNGTFAANAARNPFPMAGGIWSPAGEPGRVGAEFGVGANRINETVGGPFTWANHFSGLLGGVAVWDTALAEADVARACALARGF
jgi:hypothetical protein